MYVRIHPAELSKNRTKNRIQQNIRRRNTTPEGNRRKHHKDRRNPTKPKSTLQTSSSNPMSHRRTWAYAQMLLCVQQRIVHIILSIYICYALNFKQTSISMLHRMLHLMSKISIYNFTITWTYRVMKIPIAHNMVILLNMVQIATKSSHIKSGSPAPNDEAQAASPLNHIRSHCSLG